jgi:hypothetical protein
MRERAPASYRGPCTHTATTLLRPSDLCGSDRTSCRCLVTPRSWASASVEGNRPQGLGTTGRYSLRWYQTSSFSTVRGSPIGRPQRQKPLSVSLSLQNHLVNFNGSSFGSCQAIPKAQKAKRIGATGIAPGLSDPRSSEKQRRDTKRDVFQKPQAKPCGASCRVVGPLTPVRVAAARHTRTSTNRLEQKGRKRRAVEAAVI